MRHWLQALPAGKCRARPDFCPGAPRSAAPISEKLICIS
jgi:hypothetical protein